MLEDQAEIAELVNVNVRKEWESDNHARGKVPNKSSWLRSLESRRWRLETLSMEGIKQSQEIVSIRNEAMGRYAGSVVHDSGADNRFQ